MRRRALSLLLLLVMAGRPLLAFERQIDRLPARTDGSDRLHLPDALAPWLLAAVARSPTAASIYRAVLASPCYVYFAPFARDRRYRAEVEIHGVDRGSGLLVARVSYDPEVERRALNGAPSDEDLAFLFHELFHVQELTTVAGAADVTSIGRATRALVRRGAARPSGSGRVETPAAVAVTEAILRELSAGAGDAQRSARTSASTSARTGAPG